MSRNSAALGRPSSSRDFLASLSRKFFPTSPHRPKCSITKGITLTVDPPGRFSFAYFAFFLSSLLSAAAPSDSDDLGKYQSSKGVPELYPGQRRNPCRGQMPQCLVYHLNLNSDVVTLFGGAHLALEDSQTNLMLWLNVTKLAHNQIYMLTDK